MASHTRHIFWDTKHIQCNTWNETDSWQRHNYFIKYLTAVDFLWMIDMRINYAESVHFSLQWTVKCIYTIILRPYTECLKMSQIWLAIALTHIHQFLQFLANVISRYAEIGRRYNFLKYLAFTYFIIYSEVIWLKWHIVHVTVTASWKRCVNMVFSVNDKVLIKSLYQFSGRLIQTFN